MAKINLLLGRSSYPNWKLFLEAFLGQRLYILTLATLGKPMLWGTVPHTATPMPVGCLWQAYILWQLWQKTQTITIVLKRQRN